MNSGNAMKKKSFPRSFYSQLSTINSLAAPARPRIFFHQESATTTTLQNFLSHVNRKTDKGSLRLEDAREIRFCLVFPTLSASPRIMSSTFSYRLRRGRAIRKRDRTAKPRPCRRLQNRGTPNFQHDYVQNAQLYYSRHLRSFNSGQPATQYKPPTRFKKRILKSSYFLGRITNWWHSYSVTCYASRTTTCRNAKQSNTA